MENCVSCASVQRKVFVFCRGEQRAGPKMRAARAKKNARAARLE